MEGRGKEERKEVKGGLGMTGIKRMICTTKGELKEERQTRQTQGP